MPRIPAYVAIAESLRARIESGELKPGDRLPAERELVDDFNVARMTVRHALDTLQMEGLIDRKRGRTGGTFVRSIPPVLDLTRIVGIDRQLREIGLEQTHQVVQSGIVEANHSVSSALSLELGDPVFRTEIVRYIADNPAIVEVFYVAREFESVIEHLDLALIDAFSITMGTTVDRREDLVTPGAATDAERKTLDVPGGTQLLRITRKTFAGEEVIAYSELAIRPDVAQVRVVTHREDETSLQP
ncbi:GntR family transcriptional regulator [Corynebacterium breve]|uniref:GntR family transcriptional regulator n=1 Tax=Corynebacterium breve TaxID=3049799 RepID=A0ABY8VE28_9CORY|nr:GntR family transcriptional regulator [Corynebacterium breve]WIM67206.1 GntR family transcriptional regulator [Corynebacterium breve]